MNWPGFTPCCPRAGPMGGAGVAVPPGAWSLNWTVISFLAMTYFRRSIGCLIGYRRIDDRRLDPLAPRAVVTASLLDDYAASGHFVLPACGNRPHQPVHRDRQKQKGEETNKKRED